MKRIYAPWRIEYIECCDKQDGCFLCNPEKDNLIIFQNELVEVVMNKYPYNPGHLLVAPRRHVGDVVELKDQEYAEMFRLSQLCVKTLRNSMNPEGFNLGINVGRTAGAGLEGHVHLHVVPRWNGDTNFMPVFDDVRVIPESMQKTHAKLKEEFMKLV